MDKRMKFVLADAERILEGWACTVDDTRYSDLGAVAGHLAEGAKFLPVVEAVLLRSIASALERIAQSREDGDVLDLCDTIREAIGENQ